VFVKIEEIIKMVGTTLKIRGDENAFENFKQVQLKKLTVPSQEATLHMASPLPNEGYQQGGGRLCTQDSGKWRGAWVVSTCVLGSATPTTKAHTSCMQSSTHDTEGAAAQSP